MSISLELFFSLLSLLGCIFLILGKKYAHSHQNKQEFFVGKRDLGLFSLTMTFFAAQIGGGALLGTAEEAFKHGWAAYSYPLGLVLGMLVIAQGFGAKLRELELVTVSEMYEKLYGSKALRSFSSALFIVSLFLILVAQATAARKFFVALGQIHPIFFLGSWGMMTFYSSMGGLKAAIGTDIIQGIVKLLALLLLWCWTFYWPPSETPAIVAQFSPEPTPWVDWLLMPLFFMLIAQDMGQRCFAAKSPKTVTKAAILSATIFAIVSLIPVYMGVKAKTFGIEPTEGSAIFLLAASHFTNPYVTALCAVGVLMALISIANSLLCSISAQVACDFSFFSKHHSANFAKIITACVGILAAIVSYGFSNVISLIVTSYELSVSILFVSIFAVLLGKPLTSQQVIRSMVLGAIGYGLGHMLQPPIPVAIFAMLLSTLSFFPATTQKLDRN